MVEKENQTSLECFDGISGVEEGQEQIVLEFTNPLKRCSRCGEWLDKNEFYRIVKGNIGGKSRVCKICDSKWGKNHYVENRDQIRRRQNNYEQENKELLKERNFLYRNKKSKGFIQATGMCMICGINYDPFALESHHLFPWDKGFVYSICGNCHVKRKSKSKYAHMISVLQAIENSNYLWDEHGHPREHKTPHWWDRETTQEEAEFHLREYRLPDSGCSWAQDTELA